MRNSFELTLQTFEPLKSPKSLKSVFLPFRILQSVISLFKFQMSRVQERSKNLVKLLNEAEKLIKECFVKNK